MTIFKKLIYLCLSLFMGLTDAKSADLIDETVSDYLSASPEVAQVPSLTMEEDVT